MEKIRKFIVVGKYINYLKPEEIEAENEEEAKDKYQELFENGEIAPEEVDLILETKII